MIQEHEDLIRRVASLASGYGSDYDCTVEVESIADDHAVVVILVENDDLSSALRRAKVEVLAIEHPLLDRTLFRVTILGGDIPQIVGASGRMLFASLYA